MDKLSFCDLNDKVSAELQELAFRHGFKWNNGDTIVRHGFPVLVVQELGKIVYSSYSRYAGATITITNDHVSRFRGWILKHCVQVKEENKQSQLTPESPKPVVTTPVNLTPYEAMVSDIENRIVKRFENFMPAEDKIRDMVTTEFAKIQKTTIVIENRRKTPAEITEIKEATHKAMPELLGVLQSDCWSAIVGPTGGGKTIGALQCAKILGINIVCIKQMTRIISPHDLIGYMNADGHYVKGAWTDAILGYVYHNNGTQPEEVKHEPAMIVVDEMDNSNENVIMIIKGLQTGHIAMPYGMQEVNKGLLVVSTMNTWGTGATREYVGRCAQDAALLNEFQFIEWDYDTEFEWTLLQNLYNSYKDTGEYEVMHMRRLLDMFIAMRKKAETQKVRVIISTRNIISVAKMLICNPKWSIHSALLKSVYKGLKEEEIKRVECPEHWLSPAEQRKRAEATKRYPNTTSTSEECPI